MIGQAITIEPPTGHRRISGRLMTGIVALPLVFSWFTLRKGYSPRARAASLGYAAFCLVTTVMGLMALLSMVATVQGAAKAAGDNARIAMASRRVIVTTPEYLSSGMAAGRDAEFAGHILQMAGRTSKFDRKAQGSMITLTGDHGGTVTAFVTSDAIRGSFEDGANVSLVCNTYVHVLGRLQLLDCSMGAPGDVRLPDGAHVEYRGLAAPPAPVAPVPRYEGPTGFGVAPAPGVEPDDSDGMGFGGEPRPQSGDTANPFTT